MPALQHTVLGLQPHTTYDFEVAAATVNGTGPYTPTLSLRTNQSGMTLPYIQSNPFSKVTEMFNIDNWFGQ